jgi:putative ABC transport system permease protein
MTNWIQDLRFAARQLRKSPVFALTACLTLALGIGVTAAAYSVVQAVLLEPLPYPEQDRLIGLAWTFPHGKPNAEQAGSSADFVRDHIQDFSSVAVMNDSASQVNFSINGGHAKQVVSVSVSEGYFRTLGVSPALGRAFLTDEDRPGGARVAVLSDGLWSSIFHRDPAVVGRSIRLNEESFVVVGVMPSGFGVTSETSPGVMAAPDLWQPLQLSEKDPGYDGDNYEMIARLKPGAGLAHVQAKLDALNEPFYRQYPFDRKWTDDANSLHEFRAWPLKDVVVGDVRRSLLTVMGAVIAVLLVACLNLAGLMIARALRRSQEMAVRSALGATKLQILRLVACEGLLLALGGGFLALPVASVSAALLLHASPLEIPALRGIPGWPFLSAVVFGVALASTCLFSVLPAWAVLHKRSSVMRLGNAGLGESLSHARLSRVLMVVQVALAMVLVSTASVLMGTFVKLRALPSGIEPKLLSVFQVTLKGKRYATTMHTTQFVDKVLDGLRGMPGIQRAAAINGLPLDRGLNMGAYPSGRVELERTVEFRAVTPGYFQAMGIGLIAGRDISVSDRAEGEPVVLIGETAAKKWWPGRSPIGDTVRIGKEKYWRIVGVVADVPQQSLIESQGIVIYGPIAQLSDDFTAIVNGWFSTSFAIRTSGRMDLAESVQQIVAQGDPDIPVARFTSMQAVIDDTMQAPRFFSFLAAGFSGFALLLTVIGLFGLLSYQVMQRTREIGVRMALGADRASILRAFLLRGFALAVMGVAVGSLASWWLRPVIHNLLVDAGADTGGTSLSVVMSSAQAMMIAIGTILAASIAASWLPARSAASVEPMQALRAE